jgi:FkbM family methyltransferase
LIAVLEEHLQEKSNLIGPADNHGQDLDYIAAKMILSHFSRPNVVDIGAERGSFTELALECAARHVAVFEPLPRHFRFLQSKFGDRPEVELLPIAVSDRSGQAELKIATDVHGAELDYYHTLSPLGDTGTVFRNAKTICVETASLSDLASGGKIPAPVDFLKIDTEGHDLSVLEGLGSEKPRVIMAEFWINLPETSGQNQYTLADLINWGTANGYSDTVIIRRQQTIETIEFSSSWAVDGDWGNIIFFRDRSDFAELNGDFQRLAADAFLKTSALLRKLTTDCEEKEAVIQGLKSALEKTASGPRKSSLIGRLMSWVR